MQSGSTRDEMDKLINGYPCVYYMRFDNGVVKFGWTTMPRNRLRVQAAQAAGMGLKVTEWWVSQAHSNAAANEQAILKRARELYGLGSWEHRTEYFRIDSSLIGQILGVLQYEPWTPRETDQARDAFTYWVDQHPLTAQAYLWEVLRGDLLLIDVETGQVLDLAAQAEAQWAARQRKDAQG